MAHCVYFGTDHGVDESIPWLYAHTAAPTAPAPIKPVKPSAMFFPALEALTFRRGRSFLDFRGNSLAIDTRVVVKLLTACLGTPLTLDTALCNRFILKYWNRKMEGQRTTGVFNFDSSFVKLDFICDGKEY